MMLGFWSLPYHPKHSSMTPLFQGRYSVKMWCLPRGATSRDCYQSKLAILNRQANFPLTGASNIFRMFMGGGDYLPSGDANAF